MPQIETQKCKLVRIDELSSTVRTFVIEPEFKKNEFIAGQFCMVHVPDGEKFKKKAYSFASAPSQTGEFDLCIKLVEGGLATEWFWTLEKGTEFNVSWPYGKFVLPENLDSDLIFIATGTGLAPFRSMIQQLYYEKPDFSHRVSLIFGVRYEQEVLYDEEWRQLARDKKNFHYYPTISRPKAWNGLQGYVQDHLSLAAAGSTDALVYICGLVPMVEAVNAKALELGFPKENVHFEKYV